MGWNDLDWGNGSFGGCFFVVCWTLTEIADEKVVELYG